MTWEINVSILMALITIAGLIVKLTRRFGIIEQLSEDTAKKLKKYQDRGSISEVDCNIEREKCRHEQEETNNRILMAIEKMESRYEKNHERSYSEIMKLNSGISRIEGYLGKEKFQTQ